MPGERNNPIGVFDSGVGGLTVVKEIMRQMPNEDIVYFGDTARVPYGTKSRQSIVRFSKENVDFLIKQKVKMIVVACNTASSLALSILKESCSVPMVGVIVPGVKKAVATTRTKHIGIIATTSTIHSQEYTRGIKQHDATLTISSCPCPLFVPLVEEGWVDKSITRKIAQEYLKTMQNKNIDTLILGCTHYPLLKGVLKKVMGQGVTLIDSAEEVASEVKKILVKEDKQSLKKGPAQYTFWVTDEPEHFGELARRFLGFDVKNVKRCPYV